MEKILPLMLLLVFSFASLVNAEVKDVSISGSIDLDLIWRNNFTDFDNDTKDQPAYAELEANLPIVAKFTDNVSTRIELEENPECSNGAGSANIGFDIDEAYVTCNEFLWDNLTFQMGKQEILYSIRGAVSKKSLRRNPSWLIRSDDPTGIIFKLEASKAITLDLFWFKFDERSGKKLNSRHWAVNDETGNSSDQDLYGVVLTYTWENVNVLRGMALYWNDNKTNSSVLNNNRLQAADKKIPVLSFGTDFFFFDKRFEMYGELSYEFGICDAPAHRDLNAFGGYFGAEYTWRQIWRPYLGIEFHYLEGDDSDSAQWQDFDSSYATTLIFEGDNQDAKQFEEGGYLRISALAGLKTLPHNLRLDLLASWLQDTDESADNTAGDNIGWEFDAILSWTYTPNLKFEFGFGWFLVDDDYAKNGGPRGVNGYNPDAQADAAWLFIMNTTVRF